MNRDEQDKWVSDPTNDLLFKCYNRRLFDESGRA